MSEDMNLLLRDGIAVEKGITLTKEFLDQNEELFTKYLNLWQIRMKNCLLST